MESHAEKNDDFLIEKSLHLALIEVFLGSFIHSIHLPFGGHLLSLNQATFLRLNTKSLGRKRGFIIAFEISTIVSLLKALSPSGKKLGPMISLSAQGFLFACGSLIFGTRFVGSLLSMAVASVWAFFQPFVTYSLLYGGEFYQALTYASTKLKSGIFPFQVSLWELFFILLFGKILLGVGLMTFAEFRPDLYFGLFNWVEKKWLKKPQAKPVSALKGGIRDLCRPSVLVSFVLMGTYLAVTGKDSALIFLKLFRAIGIAFILFYLTRSPWFADLCLKLIGRFQYGRRLFTLTQSVGEKVRTRLG